MAPFLLFQISKPIIPSFGHIRSFGSSAVWNEGLANIGIADYTPRTWTGSATNFVLQNLESSFYSSISIKDIWPCIFYDCLQYKFGQSRRVNHCIFKFLMTRTIRTSRHTPSWLLQKLDEKTFSFVKKHVHPFLRGEKLKNNGELPGNMPLLRSFVVYLGFHNKDFKALKPDHLVTTNRGASLCDGKSPIGWPLYKTRVWSSSISESNRIVS